VQLDRNAEGAGFLVKNKKGAWFIDKFSGVH